MNVTWRRVWVVGAATLAVACGDSKKIEGDDGSGGGGSGGGQVPAQPIVFDIQSAELPATGRPTVTFKVTAADGGAIDLLAEIANANASPAAYPNTVPRFTLAALDENDDYTSLYASDVAPRAYTPPPGAAPPPTGTFSQGTYQPPARNASGPAPFPVQDLESLGGGVYRLTLPETNVTRPSRSLTHTVAGWLVRTTASGADPLIGFDSQSFVPGGGSASTAHAVNDTSCASCHGFVQAHGTRRGVELCMTCHSPHTTDPETSRTVDFKVMIHKIHAGADLPTVLQGTPYFIVGFQQSVLDFSDVAIPWYRGVGDCAVCHNSAPEAGRYASKASLAACTSCHDQVKFDGSAGKLCGAAGGNWYDDCNHPVAVADPTPQTCQSCHSADAVRGYHGQ